MINLQLVEFLEHLLSFLRIQNCLLLSVDFLKLSMSYRSLNTETTDIARRRYTRCNNGGVVNEVYHLKPYQILWKYLQKCERDDHQINQSAFWRLSCLLFESFFFLLFDAHGCFLIHRGVFGKLQPKCRQVLTPVACCHRR